MGGLSRTGARVAIVVVLVTFVSASFISLRSALLMPFALLLPLACILYPSAMGSVKGLGYITRTSSPMGVSVLGRAVLFGLMSVILIAALTHRSTS